MVTEPLTDSEADWGKFNKYEMSTIWDCGFGDWDDRSLQSTETGRMFGV